MRNANLLRRHLAVLAVVVVAMATTASVAAAKPAEQSPSPTAHAAFELWIVSKTYCLGKRDTRTLISVLNGTKDGVTLTTYLAETFPGFIGKLVGAGLKFPAKYLDDWAKDTARAYLHSGRRGAKVRLGIRVQVKFGIHGPQFLGLDAKKRGRRC